MNALEEKKILISGIEDIKSKLSMPKASSSDLLELLNRLETLRCCLEVLIKKEISA